MPLRRAVFACLAATAVATVSSPARAEPRTWDFLTTGNGYGFQVYDAVQRKVVTFLEHPYRFVAPPPSSDPTADGVLRRNLAYDAYFGVRAPGGVHGWLNAATGYASASYVDESNVVVAPGTFGPLAVESYFFAPFGYAGNAMVALLHAPGATDGYALLNFHLGNGRPDPDATGESVRAIPASNAIVETGPGGGAMVYVALSGFDHAGCSGVYAALLAGDDLADGTSCAGDDVVPAFQQRLDAGGWMAVAVQFVEDAAGADAAAASLAAWGNGRAPDRILADARAEFDAWRKPLPAGAASCTDDEKRVWRQSETVLRMAQVAEPKTATRDNTGMILASLPPGAWHVGWVRDATYAIAALSRMGHYAEAKAALDFLLAESRAGRFASYVSNVDYTVSVCRYYGTGEEEADYSGQSSPNVEIDGWGLAMWAARQYVEASGDVAWLASRYPTLRNGVAAALEANLEASGIAKADSSIWEVHDANKKHFAYTTEAAARGFCDFAALAKRAGASADQAHYAAVAAKARAGLATAFVDAQGALGGSTEALATPSHHDAAVAEAFNWDLLADPRSSSIAKATVDALRTLKVASGGFERNDDGASSYDSDEWLFADLRVSDVLRRTGDAASAEALWSTVVAKAAANFDLLPELYNAIPADGALGKYKGSIPMVGYGAGVFVLTALDRAGQGAASDCGDGAPAPGGPLEAVACSAGAGDAGADGGAPAGGPGGAGADGGDAGAAGVGAAPGDGGQGSGCACALAGRARAPKRWPLLLVAGLLFAATMRRTARRRA